MFKIILLSTILILPLSSQAAMTTCDLVSSLSSSVLQLKTKEVKEDKVLEAINNALKKYKEDFTYNQFRKLKLQMESVINKTYRTKTKKNLSDYDFRMYGYEWAEKCKINKIRIY